MNPTTRVLIIRFSSIGDIVLTTPIARAMKTQLDGVVEIHYLTKKSFAPLLAHNPYIDQVHSFDRLFTEVLDEMLEADFDYVVDLQGNLKSAIARKKLKKLDFKINKKNVRKWIYVNLGKNVMPEEHIVDRYFETVKAFGAKEDGKGLEYFAAPEEQEKADKAIAELAEPYIVVAVGAAHLGKRVPVAKWIDILTGVNFTTVLLGGPEDTEAATQIAAALPQKTIVQAGKITLDQSAIWTKNADVVLTGDTGMMHIASAFKKRIVSFWGCTVPEFGMSPYMPHEQNVMLAPHGRKKRPCSKLGNRCKYKEDWCIGHIDTTEAIAAVKGILGE